MRAFGGHGDGIWPVQMAEARNIGRSHRKPCTILGRKLLAWCMLDSADQQDFLSHPAYENGTLGGNPLKMAREQKGLARENALHDFSSWIGRGQIATCRVTSCLTCSTTFLSVAGRRLVCSTAV